MRALGICLLTVSSAGAAVPPVIPGDSERGAKLFENERCVQCHSVNGKGGKMGMDLSARVDRGFTPALTCECHVEPCAGDVGGDGGGGNRASQAESSGRRRSFRVFVFDAFFRQAGRRRAGQAGIHRRHCADCHGITDSRAEGAPPVVKWESLGQPIVLVQQMWDHSSTHAGSLCAQEDRLAGVDGAGAERHSGVPAQPAGDARNGGAFLLHIGRRRAGDLRIQGLREMSCRQTGSGRPVCTI